MPKWNTTHVHLTHMVGRGAVVERLPETITGMDAALRLLEEIAALYVERGCRIARYGDGIRIYDCKDSNIKDQSYEVHRCDDANCGRLASNVDYGQWIKADRQHYLSALQSRGLMQ